MPIWAFEVKSAWLNVAAYRYPLPIPMSYQQEFQLKRPLREWIQFAANVVSSVLIEESRTVKEKRGNELRQIKIAKLIFREGFLKLSRGL